MEVVAKMGEYERYLRSKGFSANTIASYIWVAAYFERNYPGATVDILDDYRGWLTKTFKPTTANQRIQAINRYLCFIGRDDLKLRSICVQQTTYLEHAISESEYKRFVSYLEDVGYLRDCYAVRLMATTGVRVSELLRMEVCHVRAGYMDLRSKGKSRRVHVPGCVAHDVLAWTAGEGRDSGPLFLNRYGEPITARGLSYLLKLRARECGLDERLVHPHAFRHLFARRFLEAGGDIVFLADLLGHTSVETTRVYLRRTAEEQHAELERLVTW